MLDHNLEQGNPPGAPQLGPAIKRVIKRTGRTADGGRVSLIWPHRVGLIWPHFRHAGVLL